MKRDRAFPYFSSFAAVLLLAAACLIGPGCSRESFVAGRSFDFLAELGSAEVRVKGIPVDGVLQTEHRPPWTADERLYYLVSDRMVMKYRGIPIGHRPRLHVGFGLNPHAAIRADIPRNGTARFRIDVIVNGQYRTVMEESITPFEMQPGEIVEKVVPLNGLEVESCDFHFHTDISPNLEPTMPVWCGLRLVSDGREMTGDESDVTYRRSVALLLDTPVEPFSGDSNKAFRADFDETSRQFTPRKDGRLLIQPVPGSSDFHFQVRDGVPDRAHAGDDAGLHLSFGIAVTAAENKPNHDRVTFTVSVDDERVFEREVPVSGGGSSNRISIPIRLGESDSAVVRLAASSSSRPASGAPGAGTSDAAVAVWVNPVIEASCRSTRQRAGDGPNVILMVVDAMRADHLSCYGYERRTTRNLDRLARKGIIFDSAFAQSSWTVPSTATLLTGQYSYTHGLYDVDHWFLVPGITTITQAFQRSGLSTAAFVANHLISRDNNFATGFESFQTIPYCTAAQLNRAFLNWLDGHEGERFFAYLHYMETHLPYAAPEVVNLFGDPPPEVKRDLGLSEKIVHYFEGHMRKNGAPIDLDHAGCADDHAEQTDDPDRDTEDQAKHAHDHCDHGDDAAYVEELIGLYDTEIVYWDERLALLCDELEDRGLMDDTIIVVTSDHGEEFAEHGMFRHGQSLYDELLHVPLIFLNTEHDPGRRDEMVGLLDVAPTLLELTGIPPDRESDGNPKSDDDPGPAFAGRNLFGGEAGHSMLFAETAHGMRFVGSGMITKRAAFSKKWKGIWAQDAGRLALFDRENDRMELDDVGEENPDLERKMTDRINEWVESCRRAAPYNISLFNAEALEKLKAMGYIR